jgi:hypothetical protein
LSAYLDTSVLAAYYLPESASQRVDAAVRRVRGPLLSAIVDLEPDS